MVSSFVSDVMMPPIGLLIGKVDFSNLFINLGEGSFHSLAEAKKAGVPTINYGLFLNQSIDFIIITFVIFLLMKGINSLNRAEFPHRLVTKNCPYCLSKIPDAATKCSFCTSELGQNANPAADGCGKSLLLKY
ncbi:MAG: large-conductance mechanosensitive channel protein MscL [Bdellovibrionia bacterium]